MKFYPQVYCVKPTCVCILKDRLRLTFDNLFTLFSCLYTILQNVMCFINNKISHYTAKNVRTFASHPRDRNGSFNQNSDIFKRGDTCQQNLIRQVMFLDDCVVIFSWKKINICVTESPQTFIDP